MGDFRQGVGDEVLLGGGEAVDECSADGRDMTGWDAFEAAAGGGEDRDDAALVGGARFAVNQPGLSSWVIW
ncbi:hypothetical protein [Nocardia terpenica]|uniref:Uncharacterized protein n=1 Tax=Nocardia terpenica TaxID=455432 RepID=A0A164LX92_9NOCA|nr:hypothetical protein [Nocardia terpenica]KZM72835.1 hypothetical protein AWN90_29150 [Nocardia terpenica]NQE92254.1 hypothetical protein [Nocardia terpenica]